MTLNDIQALTVLQLRKLARDEKIVLSAGLDKNGIVERIAAVLVKAEDQAVASIKEVGQEAPKKRRSNQTDAKKEEAAAKDAPTKKPRGSKIAEAASEDTPAKKPRRSKKAEAASDDIKEAAPKRSSRRSTKAKTEDDAAAETALKSRSRKKAAKTEDAAGEQLQLDVKLPPQTEAEVPADAGKADTANDAVPLSTAAASLPADAVAASENVAIKASVTANAASSPVPDKAGTQDAAPRAVNTPSFFAQTQPASKAPSAVAIPESEVKFQAAWHSPEANRPPLRTGFQNTYQPASSPRSSAAGDRSQLVPEVVRPNAPRNFVSRFGPPRNATATANSQNEDNGFGRASSSPFVQRRFGPRFNPPSSAGRLINDDPLDENTPADDFDDTEEQRSEGTSFRLAPDLSSGTTAIVPAPEAPSMPTIVGEEEPSFVPERDMPSLNNLPEDAPQIDLSTLDDGSGLLEMQPEGFGFLRVNRFSASSKDIYISRGQVRHLGLRIGDDIGGKLRVKQDEDRYYSMQRITSINGLSEEESLQRPSFEDLTPTYPTCRIKLETGKGKDQKTMRLLDLIAPIGFGQRGLILCQPGTDKREIMQAYARVIGQNYPEIDMLMLMIDITPEDATAIREAVPCPVIASTFDLPPEAHFRLTELALGRAMRLVEQKKDVVLLVDSLTKLAKLYSDTAPMQSHTLVSPTALVNPTSLLNAKKLFGAARACKEGGSLTIIAAMDVSTGSKMDDAIVEEFRITANMVLTLDQNVARAGITPPLNLLQSYTRNNDILLDDKQKEGLGLIRQLLGSTSSVEAIPQLQTMMDKTKSNSSLLLKMKDWVALLQRG